MFVVAYSKFYKYSKKFWTDLKIEEITINILCILIANQRRQVLNVQVFDAFDIDSETKSTYLINYMINTISQKSKL